MRPSILLALALSAAACGPATVVPPAPPPVSEGSGAEAAPVVAPSRLPEGITPTRYALTLQIAPAAERFSGEADIDLRVEAPSSSLWIHGQNLAVSEVSATGEDGARIEGRWTQVDAEEGVARLAFERPVGPGAVRLHLVWTAPFDETLEGLYRVNVGDDAYAFTQFEPLSARRAFPSFDEPRFKTPFDVTLVVPSALGAFANSRDVESTPLPEGRRQVRFAPTEPLPTYLVAWAVGPLDVVEGAVPPSAVRPTALPLRGLAPRGRGPELAFAMEHTPRIVAALEAYFGIAYPYDKLDIVAVPDFSAGAMENAGLVTFRDVLLLLGPDAPVGQRRGFAFVMAHELAHQWFGNLVTMAWWDDLWLNEAFATWMETRIVQAVFPEMRAEVTELMTALDAFDADSLASARQIRNPITATHDIHNAFDSITYSKGASVLEMFETWMGEAVFQRGIHDYLQAHRGGNATASDLMAALATASGREVRAPMETFLLQPGVPTLDVDVVCAADAAAHLSLVQHRYSPVGSHAEAGTPWQVPVCARYRVGGAVHETCTMLAGPEGTLALEVPGCPDWVLPNTEGHGYYRWTLPDALLARLMRPEVLTGLSVRDRISIADSVRAGEAAGRIGYAEAARALAPFADAPERQVATAAVELLTFARDALLETDAERAAFGAYASRLYRATARRLGWGPRGRATEDGETRLLRAAVLSFLALTADDPAVRREARARGRAYVGDGPRGGAAAVHPEAVPADLAQVSLIVAAQEGGVPFFERLSGLFGGTQDAVVRGHLLAAMARVDDPDTRPLALALALDPRLRVNEALRPLMAQMSDPDGREAAWAWLQSNHDALAARVGPGAAGYLPLAAGNFCSAERAAEVRAFFAPRVEATQGGPRNLESAVESIELCAARAERQRSAARAFFAGASR